MTFPARREAASKKPYTGYDPNKRTRARRPETLRKPAKPG